MKSLGLNPSEQAVIDIPNHIGRNGLIYFADFCQLVLDWFREDASQEEAFRQAMFRVRPRYRSISYLDWKWRRDEEQKNKKYAMFGGHVWNSVLWDRLQSQEIQTEEPFSLEGDKNHLRKPFLSNTVSVRGRRSSERS